MVALGCRTYPLCGHELFTEFIQGKGNAELGRLLLLYHYTMRSIRFILCLQLPFASPSCVRKANGTWCTMCPLMRSARSCLVHFSYLFHCTHRLRDTRDSEVVARSGIF